MSGVSDRGQNGTEWVMVAALTRRPMALIIWMISLSASFTYLPKKYQVGLSLKHALKLRAQIILPAS